MGGSIVENIIKKILILYRIAKTLKVPITNEYSCVYFQEEYMKEGIQWKNIEFIDNTGCLYLFSRKPTGLFHLIDEECK